MTAAGYAVKVTCERCGASLPVTMLGDVGGRLVFSVATEHACRAKVPVMAPAKGKAK